MAMDEQALQAIDDRASAAMPGPWAYELDFTLQRNRIVDAEGTVVAYGNAAINEVTSAFIAHARADVPALVAELRRLRTIEAAARAWVEDMEEYALDHADAEDDLWDGEAGRLRAAVASGGSPASSA